MSQVKNNKECSVRFRCTEEDRRMLEELTVITDRTASGLIRKLIKDYYQTIKIMK